MTTTSIQWLYLERDPKSAYRQLSIKGKRIKARTLFGLYASADEPMTVEQIAEAYELPIEAVREAIACCQSNPPEIQQDFQVEQALAEAAGMNAPDYHGRPKVLSPQEYEQIRERYRGVLLPSAASEVPSPGTPGEG